MAFRLVVSLFLVLIASNCYSNEEQDFPKLDIGKGGQCVDDPKIMRKVHMNFLKHQRDETVHKGIRGQKYSIAECVECHAGEKTNSVLGSSEAFCQGCHEYAAVKLDCFECHTSKRKGRVEAKK